jgi:hypothetical protein
MAPARIGLPDRQSENFSAAIRFRLGAGISGLFRLNRYLARSRVESALLDCEVNSRAADAEALSGFGNGVLLCHASLYHNWPRQGPVRMCSGLLKPTGLRAHGAWGVRGNLGSFDIACHICNLATNTLNASRTR